MAVNVTPCYGRDTLIADLLQFADERKCVLLFGGRQAGKTTVLRHAQGVSVEGFRRSPAYGDGVLAVYVDLMALPYTAGPAEFYGCLLDQALQVCRTVFDGRSVEETRTTNQAPKVQTVDAFLDGLQTLFQARRGVRRLVFLLDEAGRVLGRRFPRAFQDNLFSMLYVDPSGAAQRIALVFTGAQELAGFCEDDTSPLGSRAEHVDLRNLEVDAFGDLARSNIPAIDDQMASYLFDETGGHAGLAAKLFAYCRDHGAPTSESAPRISSAVAGRSRRLFEHWMAHFSEEAKVTLERLAAAHVGLLRRDVARLLATKGKDRFRAERAWHELQYVGVCRADGKGRLTRCNDWFWRYYQEFDTSAFVGTSDEQRVWDLIREAETALRTLVYSKYRLKWPGREYEMMERVLGPAWKKIEEVRRKAAAAYSLSPNFERSLMDCMYLGQLGDLVVSNQAWALFQSLFNDKARFRRMLQDIHPVRNDIAHFVPGVPQKELWRCRIACDDVLVIVKRATDEQDI